MPAPQAKNPGGRSLDVLDTWIYRIYYPGGHWALDIFDTSGGQHTVSSMLRQERKHVDTQTLGPPDYICSTQIKIQHSHSCLNLRYCSNMFICLSQFMLLQDS